MSLSAVISPDSALEMFNLINLVILISLFFSGSMSWKENVQPPKCDSDAEEVEVLVTPRNINQNADTRQDIERITEHSGQGRCIYVTVNLYNQVICILPVSLS